MCHWEASQGSECASAHPMRVQMQPANAWLHLHHSCGLAGVHCILMLRCEPQLCTSPLICSAGCSSVQHVLVPCCSSSVRAPLWTSISLL